jgi:hypothetical protein
MTQPSPPRRPPTWRELQADTAPWAEKLQFQFFRETSPAQELRAMARLNRCARTFSLSGIRKRHPQAPEAELRRRLTDKLLGPELVLKLYGPIAPEIPPENGEDKQG